MEISVMLDNVEIHFDMDSECYACKFSDGLTVYVRNASYRTHDLSMLHLAMADAARTETV